MLHDMEQEDGEGLSVEQFKAALYAAIQLLGNASAQVSRLRRKKILKSINPEIQDLAEEDLFSAAAPYLFGEGFEQKMKDRAESLKILS